MNNVKRRTIFFTAVFLITAVICNLSAQEPARKTTRRLGLFVGSNNGGRDRVMLRYAVSDAKAVSRVFNDMGGIVQGDNILLVEPTVRDINRQLDALGRELASARKDFQRTELVFYYSGHSDEEGLLLNRESYSYRDLRERINLIDTDMRIVILDSCSSGAITRAKGGVKAPPFLFDSSVSVEGYAFLTSSSADETSQESDSIESSYFTHSLVAGLRGAADTVGDGKVTLNELYRFAYSETLAKTETSLYGAQHPSYDMQISGSGDVVLTDIRETSASLLIDGELTGRITIRDEFDFLVAELTKINQNPLELGLSPGLYRVTIQKGDNFYRAEMLLRENVRTPLGMKDFSLIASSSGNRRRGDYEGMNNDDSDDIPFNPTNIQLLPGFDLAGHSREKATNGFLLGIFVGFGHNIRGLGVASIGLINTGYVKGIQASGIFNYAEGDINGIQCSGIFSNTGGDVQGIQTSGIFNYADGNVQGIQSSGIFNYGDGNVRGIQASSIFNYAGNNVSGIQAGGIFNLAKGDFEGVQSAGITNYTYGSFNGLQAGGIYNWVGGDMKGLQSGLVNRRGEGETFSVQAGLVNISASENTLPIGLVNVVRNGMIHPSVYMDDMFSNVGFRSGSKHFYSHFSFGAGGGFLPWRNEDRIIAGRGGFGYEYSIGKFFIDIDASTGTIVNVDTFDTSNWKKSDTDNRKEEESFSASSAGIHQLRLTAGYKIYEHLGVFAGVSYDYIYRYNNSGPMAEDYSLVMAGKSRGKHTHKMGFFGGVQF